MEEGSEVKIIAIKMKTRNLIKITGLKTDFMI